MTVIVDYGVGNLFSLVSSFRKIGEDAVVSADPATLAQADRIILPGVGAFGDAADKLRSSGVDSLLLSQVRQGKPVMGICLGMQLLFDRSMEYGQHEGLGLIPGEIRPLSERAAGLKIPHMGWNALSFPGEKHPLFRYVQQGECVYFVHSYYGAASDPAAVIATAEYGFPVTAAVAGGNVMGCQFHPEKSGETGLRVLQSFCEMKEGSIC